MTAIASGTRAGAWAGSFYVWMFAACVATAFLGFIPTYWTPMAAGQFRANPVVHLHGAFFFGWTLFALTQAVLVPTRHVALHRTMGMVGISYATILTMLGLLAALNALQVGIAAGYGPAAKAFLIVPLAIIATFAVLFGLGVANIRRPEVHKRLMLLATISVLNAPVARPLLFWVWPVVPPAQPPVWINIPACLLSYLLILPALYYDWRTRGRPHVVYLAAVPVLVFLAWVVVPISETAGWMSFAEAFLGLAGNVATPAA